MRAGTINCESNLPGLMVQSIGRNNPWQAGGSEKERAPDKLIFTSFFIDKRFEALKYKTIYCLSYLHLYEEMSSAFGAFVEYLGHPGWW